jgi:hypothetical protein
MPKDNAIEFKKPGSFVDNTITDVLNTGTLTLFGTSHPGLPEWLICEKHQHGPRRSGRGWGEKLN